MNNRAALAIDVSELEGDPPFGTEPDASLPLWLLGPDGAVQCLSPAGRDMLDRDPGLASRLAGLFTDTTVNVIVGRVLPVRALTPVLDRARHLAVFEGKWQLTPAQAAVLALVVKGDCNKDIAAGLDIREGTVESHMTAILRKSRLRSRSAVVSAFWSSL